MKIARNAGGASREVVLADVLDSPWRNGVFVSFSDQVAPASITQGYLTQDYAISIATIHHLATYERRKLAVQVSHASPQELPCVT